MFTFIYQHKGVCRYVFMSICFWAGVKQALCIKSVKGHLFKGKAILITKGIP